MGLPPGSPILFSYLIIHRRLKEEKHPIDWNDQPPVTQPHILSKTRDIAISPDNLHFLFIEAQGLRCNLPDICQVSAGVDRFFLEGHIPYRPGR